MYSQFYPLIPAVGNFSYCSFLINKRIEQIGLGVRATNLHKNITVTASCSHK